MSELVFLSLGSNLGNRVRNIANAVRVISELPNISNFSNAPNYESEPLYNQDQPPFLNTVISFNSAGNPDDFFNTITRLETAAGRFRQREKNSPRKLDIDILAWGKRISESAQLTIPHRDLQNRRFVLLPWNDIAPDFLVPKINMKVSDLLSACVDSSQVIKQN